MNYDNFMSSDNFNKIDTNFESTEYTPLPKGLYKVIITNIETKETDKMQGVNVTMEIVDGQYKGRKLFDLQAFVSTSSEKLVAWGQKKHKQMWEFSGATYDRQTMFNPLVNKIMYVDVTTSDYNNKTYNNITNYVSADYFNSKQGSTPAPASTNHDSDIPF